VNQNRSEIVAWVASQILPHEADVRRWLRRALVPGDVDDVIQEAFCRIAGLEDVSRIASARAYFFQVARNVVLEQMRRARVVQIDTVAEMEALHLIDESPSPERIAGARHELARVQRLISALPGRCRRIFELRKVHDMSQREIARQLNVSENTVEKQASRGLMLIMRALAEGDEMPRNQKLKDTEHDHRERRDDRTPRR
jgi:RNA polymerase sigma factor (sigma-70 family)